MASLQDIAAVNPKSNPLQNSFVYIDLEAVEKGELRKIQEVMREEAPSRAQRVIYKNDILFQCVRPYQKNNYIHKIQSKSNQQWVASTGYAQIRTTEIPNYIYHLLNTDGFNRKVMVRCTGSSYPAINSEDLATIRFYLTTDTKEQLKISRLLDLLDERIATQNKIIEDLKKLKSAISKQVFAQEPNGWCRLDTLFSKGKAGGTPTSTNKEYYNGEIPFLSINDITKQGKYVRYTENHLSQSGLENSSAWVVPKYSLIMSMYASVGLVTINEIPTTTSQAMFAMQLKDKGLLDYLYYYLSYFKYRYIHKYLETGTQSNINADIIRGIMIPIYGHSRNMEIASTLQGIDVKIDNELSVLKLFNKQKNYLLSQMFI
ncbi:hypothetical protein BACOV975_02537 [Bacteroides ovatus V975]|uniref:restriction endonuclease subunit S n=1 Tax=Bacteroides ovatus TaxID=28116 RepID=UPI000865C459|nr:restriction endonuclease subunit S [Bacteroides ovatus]SCV08743.1 hypothetical protein BACOV975_02537 [Bacteroides ovatus V975]